MEKVYGKLTVYFEEPFLVGVFERIEDGTLFYREHRNQFFIYDCIYRVFCNLDPDIQLSDCLLRSEIAEVERKIQE